MESLDLLLHAADALTGMGVPYMVTTITYGEARFTNYVDILADLQEQHVAPVLAAFPEPEFYISEAAVKDAIRRRFQFSVIHPASGLKIDFMVPTNDTFNQSRLSRGVSIELDDQGQRALFASAQDEILKKLQYYREGGSEKHLRDIRGVLLVQGEAIDRAYLKQWADVLGITQQLDEVLAK